MIQEGEITVSAESVIRDLRRENARLLQRVNLLEKQLKAAQELNAKQWKRLNEAERYIQRRLSENETN